MAAYASALHNVSLAGPTLFGQVINRAAQIAGESLSYNYSKYHVLLIITVRWKTILNPSTFQSSFDFAMIAYYSCLGWSPYR